jgi:drug/metabolite transporter superfamily protein YnfA
VRARMSVALGAAVACSATPGRAFAQAAGPDGTHGQVMVHLNSPRTVDLQRAPDEGGDFETLCSSPCDTFVPASGAYRVAGHFMRNSRRFWFEPGARRAIIDVHPTSRIGFASGIVLTSLGGVFVFGATLAGAFSDDGFSPSALTFLGGGAVALATGVVLIAINPPTNVAFAERATAPAQQAAPPVWGRSAAIETPRAVLVPILQGSF